MGHVSAVCEDGRVNATRAGWQRMRLGGALLLLLLTSAYAHVGSPGIFVQGKAGPYPIYVTVQPPVVIPGQAQVTVLCAQACSTLGVERMDVAANVLAGDRTQMPEGVALVPGPVGSNQFTGTAWIMTQGSWQVKVHVEGTHGAGDLAVPLAAMPTRVLTMSRPFSLLLIVLGLLLVALLAKLAAAAVTQAGVETGGSPSVNARRRGRLAAVIAVSAVAILLAGFAYLWRQAVTRASATIYRPLGMSTSVADGVLHLELTPPTALEQAMSTRRLDDLALDHNHLMHLYVISWPAMEHVFHLHPQQRAAGAFDLALPVLPAGRYRLFADVVHADGFPETATAEVDLKQLAGRPLAGDDAAGELPAAGGAGADFTLKDGYRYRFGAATPAGEALQAVPAREPVLLRFTLVDPAGHAPEDMTEYMGMPGHAAILKRDGSVFAHVHPEGSAAMAAMMLANPGAMGQSGTAGNTVAFPFGFPSSGAYRVLIQMKHGDVVETGAVDLEVR